MRPYTAIKSFFYGNYFYGICAIALSIETSFQLNLPLNNPFYYALIGIVTVLYYTHAYFIDAKRQPSISNERNQWYTLHYKKVEAKQMLFTALLGLILLLMVNGLQPHFVRVHWLSWALIFALLLISAAYYHQLHPIFGKWSLRHAGLLKPLIIGLVWAGLVSFTPVFFYDLSYPGLNRSLQWDTWLLFLDNWLYISLLSVLFDIKDVYADARENMKTWVILLGLHQTLIKLIYPITILCCLTYWGIALMQNLPLLRIVFNSMPYVLLITVCTQMHERKSILYYLAIIDGLMFVKAICGIIGTMIF